jgi:hypothetical protein
MGRKRHSSEEIVANPPRLRERLSHPLLTVLTILLAFMMFVIAPLHAAGIGLRALSPCLLPAHGYDLSIGIDDPRAGSRSDHHRSDHHRSDNNRRDNYRRPSHRASCDSGVAHRRQGTSDDRVSLRYQTGILARRDLSAPEQTDYSSNTRGRKRYESAR